MTGGIPIADLHFLRPEWLWALIPVAAIVFLLLRHQSAAARWRSLIAPHLLEHLIVRPEGRWRIRPRHMLAIGLVLTVIAVAGPSYRREPPPFTEDTAPLIIAMDLSQTMLVRDIQPSRLERAQQKVQDLLAERKGARTALIAYAGSAHMVLPLTDDPSLISTYVGSLVPSLMPLEGKDSGAALKLAEEMLQDEPTPGTILFLTDGIDAASTQQFSDHAQSSRDQIAALAVGTRGGGTVPLENGRSGPLSRLDQASFERIEKEAGAYVTTVTIDDTDLRRLQRRIASHLSAAQQENSEGRWRDEGWWLLLPLAGLALFWSRRGWTVQWDA